MTEIWVSIPEYEGFYEISNFGNIRSVERTYETNNRWGKMTKCLKQKTLKKSLTFNKKYVQVELNRDRYVKKHSIHRLVYESFFGKIKDGNIIHHIDHDKMNNKIDNLKEMNYVEHNNIHKHPAWNKGMKFGYKSRPSHIYNSLRKKIKCIETEEIFNSVTDACKKYGIPSSTMSTSIKNKTKLKNKNLSFIKI